MVGHQIWWRLMQEQGDDDLVRAWHGFFSNMDNKEKREPGLWAVHEVTRLLPNAFSSTEKNERIVGDPERMWQIILLLIKAAPNRRNLVSVCGPLRQLLESHFNEYIGKVECESLHNDRLAYALSHTFINDDELREPIRALGRNAAILHFAEDDSEKTAQLVNRLVEVWFRWIRTEEVDDEALWAIDQIGSELPFYDPNLCWQIILLLVAESQSKADLKSVSYVIEELLMFNYANFVKSSRTRSQPAKNLLMHWRTFM
jgi:hypothetical protein